MIDLTANGHVAPPASFFAEEERCGYVVTAAMKRVWAVQMDIVQELLRVCRKHGLSVWADSGTLLGAVRHGGYIPWDDDIDMAMTRADYDRLCAVAADEFREPYFWQTLYTDPYYPHRHAQLRHSATAALSPDGRVAGPWNHGIFVDVFVLDHLPSAPRRYVKHIRAVRRAKLRLKIVRRLTKRLPRSLYMRLREGGGWLSDVAQMRRLDDVCRSIDAARSFLMYPLCLQMRQTMVSTAAYAQTLVLPFEHIELPVPAGYDEVLRVYFGDYMTPRQVAAHHGAMLYDVDRSYLDYAN